MAVLVIVFAAFSDKPDAFGYFEMPAALVSVGRFAMGTPILRDNKIPAATALRQRYSRRARPSVDGIAFARNRARMENVSIRFAMTLGLLLSPQRLCFNLRKPEHSLGLRLIQSRLRR